MFNISYIAIAATVALGAMGITIIGIRSHPQPHQQLPQVATVVLAPSTVETTSTSTLATSTKEIARGDTSKKEVIFTFDGGGTIQSADAILAVLAKHHVKGTFFLTGKMVEAHPDLVKSIAAAGNEIFSHTYDHPDLTTLTDTQIVAELTKMENVLQATTGVSPKPYFRAPYGARDARVLAIASKDGYQSVYWTVDAMDWREPQGETAAQVKDRILSNVAPGTIYLMHLGDTITGSILDDVFTTIEAKGYKIVSLTQGI
jgi:peptidoglycan/xylan/chitin deacetylase (PgdA/CDA1 family)